MSENTEEMLYNSVMEEEQEPQYDPIPEYHYDEDSLEYTSQSMSFLDPLESKMQKKAVWLLSANSTFDAPPAKREGYAILWNKEENKWIEKEDHRGTKYWLPGQRHGEQPYEMKELGPLPEDAILEEPSEDREQKLAKLLPAVQGALDRFAKTRGYDSIMSACSYATSTNEWYKAEGLYAQDIRDRTWEEANTLYADLENDTTQEVPEPEDFVALLPIATAKWPDLDA